MVSKESFNSIKCFIDKDSNKSKTLVNEKPIWIDLSKAKKVSPETDDASLINLLQKIHVLINELQNFQDDILNSNVTIFLNEEGLRNILTVNGVIQKRSKSANKTITNNKIKSLSGIVIHELLKFKNLELIFENFTLKKEVNEMDNTLIYGKEEDFNLDDLDFSSLENFENNEDNKQYDNSDELFSEFNINDDFLLDKIPSNNTFEETSTIYSSSTEIDNNYILDSNTTSFAEDFTGDDKMKEDEIFVVNSLENNTSYNQIPTYSESENTNTEEGDSISFEAKPLKDFSNETPVHKVEDKENHFKEIKNNNEVNKKVDKQPKTNKEDRHIENNSKKPQKEKSDKTESIKSDYDTEFVKKELEELKKYLESKIISYESTISKLNKEYEEKHLALKDLSILDEENSLKIFKDFLNCKTTIVNLNKVIKVYSKILKNIEEEILNIIK